jgi:hypothetical protein
MERAGLRHGPGGRPAGKPYCHWLNFSAMTTAGLGYNHKNCRVPSYGDFLPRSHLVLYHRCA